MRKPRNLSGIYFRHFNSKTGKWENWCFEDLPRDEQLNIIEKKGPKWTIELALLLALKICDIGDSLDLGIKYERNNI